MQYIIIRMHAVTREARRDLTGLTRPDQTEDRSFRKPSPT